MWEASSNPHEEPILAYHLGQMTSHRISIWPMPGLFVFAGKKYTNSSAIAEHSQLRVSAFYIDTMETSVAVDIPNLRIVCLYKLNNNR
jgi:hypothetical protein